MLVFKYTVKWRVRGIFFRRFHGVATLELVGDHYVATKFNGAKAFFPAAGSEFVVGRGVNK